MPDVINVSKFNRFWLCHVYSVITATNVIIFILKYLCHSIMSEKPLCFWADHPPSLFVWTDLVTTISHEWLEQF